MAFKARNISTPKRNTATITFGGLDTSSPRFQVDPSRALDMCNYEWRNGGVQKRHGLEQLFVTIPDVSYADVEYAKPIVVGEEYANDGKALTTGVNKANEPINGLYQVGDLLIVHKGCLLYYTRASDIKTPELIKASNEYLDTNQVTHYMYTYKIPNKRSWGIVNNNTLWLLTGEKYLCIYEKDSTVHMLPVELRDDIYVPTTTIGITPSEYAEPTRATYEGINMLTAKRKNELVSGGDFTTPMTYVLDGTMTKPESVKITLITTGRR